MKLRLIALATVAAVAFSAPAMAAEGWYLGLGAGYSMGSDIDAKSVPAGTNLTATSLEGWAGIGSIGYSFGNTWRIENEVSFSEQAL